MVKETGRKCSHCGHNGHNSRTCNGKSCVKLFGVNISAAMEKQENSTKKSFSMGILESQSSHEQYLNASPINKTTRERKRGKPWTEEEHRNFLAGLKQQGKGDWRGISNNFVTTKTPTQVASHAQKYFLRQVGNDKKRRRPSLFDMAFQESESSASPPSSPSQGTARNPYDYQVNAPSQVVNRFPHPSLKDRPVTWPTASHSFLAYYRGIQPLAGGAPNGQGIPEAYMMPTSLPYLRTRYGYLAKALVCSSAAHLSAKPSPRSVQHSMFPAGPAASSAEKDLGPPQSSEKDLLELKIGPPQSPKD